MPWFTGSQRVGHDRVTGLTALEHLPALGSNLHLLHLLHWRTDSVPLSHLGSVTAIYSPFKSSLGQSQG